jgi:hypothetical protein
MKSDSIPKLRRKEQPPAELHPDSVPNLAPESADASARQATQAERGVMHPDRDDVEWRYWRGGWGRLIE